MRLTTMNQHVAWTAAERMGIETLMTMSPLQWLVAFVTKQCASATSAGRGRSRRATRDLLLDLVRGISVGIGRNCRWEGALLS